MDRLPRVSLKHVGIYVTDFDLMFDFYTRLFGFYASDVLDGKDGHKTAWMTTDPNIHHTFVMATGRAAGSASTVNQLSFWVPALGDVRKYWKALENEPVVTRKYATTHGNAWSLYFWDPEENRVEVYTDTPWHVQQPAGWKIDFDNSDEEIYRQTEEVVKSRPENEPFDEWRVRTARALGLTDFHIY